jgi:hypothetical protein
MQLGTPTHKARSFATIGERTMTEFNDTEHMSSARQEILRMAQSREKLLNMDRNKVIEEVAVAIERMRGFGPDTISSFAIYIREMKK